MRDDVIRGQTCITARPFSIPQKPVTRQELELPMKRAAKHIVIKFTIGYQRNEFRMRVGGDIERPGVDELGAANWVKIHGDEPEGLPTKAALLQAALVKVFADLPPFADPMFFPSGVSCLGDPRGSVAVITVDLGNVSP